MTRARSSASCRRRRPSPSHDRKVSTWWRFRPPPFRRYAESWISANTSYQEQKRAREAKKHQKIIEVKEIKFRPKVDEHDYQFKKKHIERFLAEGDKVKATVFFRGREMAHPEIGRRILERLIGELVDVAVAEIVAAARRQPDAHDPGAEGRRQVGAPDQRARADQRRPAPSPAVGAARPQPVAESRASRRPATRARAMPKMKTHRGAAKRFKKTGDRQIPYGRRLQAPHPDQQVDEAEAPAARQRGSVRAGAAQAANGCCPTNKSWWQA